MGEGGRVGGCMVVKECTGEWHTVHDTWSLTHCAWHMATDTLCMSHGQWHTVHDTRSMTHCAWHMVTDTLCMTHGRWHTVHDKRSMNDTLCMTHGRWHTVHDTRSMNDTLCMTHGHWHTVHDTCLISDRWMYDTCISLSYLITVLSGSITFPSSIQNCFTARWHADTWRNN